MRWAKLERALDEDSVTFVYDTQRNGNVEGLLRCLPPVLYTGIETATFPKSWLQLDRSGRHRLYEYEWRLLEDIESPTVDLVACTTQFYEDNYDIFSLRRVVNAYSTADRRLVVVGDRDDFELSGTVRPFDEDPVVDRTFSFESIYEAFEERYRSFGVELPLQDTENLFIQDNATILELASGEQVTTTRELIDMLPEAPYLPLVTSLSSIFASHTGIGSEPLDSVEAREELGKWLRRRIEFHREESLTVARQLNEFAIDHERLYDPAHRRQMPAMNEARSLRRELNPEENPIHDRYDRWLSEAIGTGT